MSMIESRREELGLDGSVNSLQRVELATLEHFDSHASLLASPEEAQLLSYLRPVFQRYAGCRPLPDEPSRMLDRDGTILDLALLLREVFEQENGQVLFRACQTRLACLPSAGEEAPEPATKPSPTSRM